MGINLLPKLVGKDSCLDRLTVDVEPQTRGSRTTVVRPTNVSPNLFRHLKFGPNGNRIAGPLSHYPGSYVAIFENQIKPAEAYVCSPSSVQKYHRRGLTWVIEPKSPGKRIPTFSGGESLDYESVVSVKFKGLSGDSINFSRTAKFIGNHGSVDFVQEFA